MVIVDDGSSREFLDEVRKIGGDRITLIEHKTEENVTFAEQKREAFRQGSKLSGVNVLLYTELEKDNLVSLYPEIVIPILQDQADIVVPSRTDKAWGSFPKDQKKWEKAGSRTINTLLRRHFGYEGSELDLFFGPRVVANRPEILELFMRRYELLDEDPNYLERWANPQMLPIVSAIESGLRVTSIDVDSYRHPKEQTAFEESDRGFATKRQAQVREQVKAVTHFILASKGDLRSKLVLDK